MSRGHHHHESSPIGPDASLTDLFWAVARQLRGVSVETLAEWEVTPSQARALRELARHGEMRPSELSEHLRIAPRSATEVVDDLEAKGLVARAPDPGDRRATLLSLTERGQTVSDGIRGSRGSQADHMFGRLSETERDELAQLLLRLLPDD